MNSSNWVIPFLVSFPLVFIFIFNEGVYYCLPFFLSLVFYEDFCLMFENQYI